MPISEPHPPSAVCRGAEPNVTLTAPQRSTCGLHNRALALRSAAAAMEPILAACYRRRASELELECWVHNLRSGDTTDDPPMVA